MAKFFLKELELLCGELRVNEYLLKFSLIVIDSFRITYMACFKISGINHLFF